MLWWHLPDNGKVHTNKCNKMIGMSRLSMSRGVSLCCPSSHPPPPSSPQRNLRKSSSSWSSCRTGVGNKALIKFHLCAPSSPTATARYASFQLGFGLGFCVDRLGVTPYIAHCCSQSLYLAISFALTIFIINTFCLLHLQLQQQQQQ